MKKVTFAIMLALGLSACKKDTPPPVVPPNNNPPPAVAEYYFKGTVNGTAVKYEELPNNDFQTITGGNSHMGTNGDGPAAVTGSIYDLERDMPGFGVTFQTFAMEGGDIPSDHFNSFITAGTWAFAASEQINDAGIGTKEIVVEYMDEDGIYYNSIGDQTGSTLTVISVIKHPSDGFSNEGLQVKISVNCTVYPASGSGTPVTITNGEAVLYIENII